MGLFFAFESPVESASKHRALFALHEGFARGAADEEGPSAIGFIRPTSGFNKRLVHQAGLFTKGPMFDDVQTWVANHFENVDEAILIKVNIPSRGRHDCLRTLNRMNINHTTGLRASAIRYYEAQGLLPMASRKGGKRIYDSSILERLAVIELAKMAGFELQEIRAGLSTGEEPALIWRKLGQAKRAELDHQISRLARMEDVLARLSGCTCVALEECGRAFNAARSQPPPDLSLEPTARLRSRSKPLARRR